MADKRKQVEGIIARMRKGAQDLLTQADDLEALLHGEDTTGQQIGQLIKAWDEQWSLKHAGKKYIHTRAIAAGGFKRLLAELESGDIRARMVQYLDSRDPFYVTSRHALNLFFASVNKFAGTGGNDDAEFLTAPVADCSHSPRCKSAQEHTRKRSQEMRA